MANYGRGNVAINVEALTYNSLETLLSGDFVMSPNLCIYKVPTILSRHNENAYVPNAFSIGPWHFGKPKLEATQNIKKKYLQGLVRRLGDPEGQLRLEEEIRKVEKEARECYAGSVDFSVEDFVKILLLDGCFIIELLRKDAKLVPKDQDDPIFSMSCLLQFLNHDLILLENQIPWLVLDRLFNMTETKETETEDTPKRKPLDQLVIEFFGNLFSFQRPTRKQLQSTNFRMHKSKHILDRLRNSLVMSIPEDEHELGWQPLPPATSLKEAGIEFQKIESNSILDIKFNKGNGILEIPTLLIQETTETIFRNLISFEQCYPHCSPRVTSYVRLLDNLINTTQDITILSKNGIIDNWLNPDVSTKFFKMLYQDAYVNDFYYLNLCEQVNIYRQTWWRRWRNYLVHKYFNTPWGTVRYIVALSVFVFTIVGTVCSIIQAIKA